MRKRTLAFVTAGFLLTGIVLYYTITVLIARAKTPAIVADILHSPTRQLTVSDLSAAQLNALLKVQDPNFYHHKGYDFTTPGTGLTTISQGMVKQLYFKHFHSGLPKIKQTLIARFAFDALTPKDTILTIFLNCAQMGFYEGHAVHGLAEAATVYLHKDFGALTWDEYLGVLAMVRAATKFHYLKHRAQNDERVARIKKLLAGEYVPKDNGDWLYDRM